MKSVTKKDLIFSKLLVLLGIISIVLFFNSLIRGLYNQANIIFILLFSLFVFKYLAVVVDWFFIWHPSIPQKPIMQHHYSVDVLTTYVKGEPKEMLKKTLLAMKDINYPHETFLCDEDNDLELKEFCKLNNIHHVTRKNKIDAKAGNINNALRHFAKGEIVLILDPDHIAYPNFLDEVLPFFENSKIGFVQVVQAYYNHNSNLITKAASEHTYQFYGPLMMTLNTYGTVPAIGANCTFRRSALDSIGGHAPGLTEDMHTTLLLRAKGWKSVYVPEIVAKGLVPWNYSSYCIQQLKWSRGSFDLLFNVFPEVFRKLPWSQKLSFLIVPFFYFFGTIAVIDFLIPIIALAFDFGAFNVDLFSIGFNYFQFILISLIIHFYHQNWYHEDKERGMAIFGGILFKASWWASCLGFIYSLLNKKVPYIPTPKDTRVETPWRLIVPNIIVIVLSFLAMLYGLYYDLTPCSIFMAILALSNILILSLGCMMAMQKQILKGKKLIRDNLFWFYKKASFLHSKRYSLYRLLSNKYFVLFPIFLIIFINIVFIQYDLNINKINIFSQEVRLKLYSRLGINSKPGFICDKEYAQIYYGKHLKECMSFSRESISFIRADYYLNKINPNLLNDFLDSCYTNNILPFISLSIDSASNLAIENDTKLIRIFKNIRKRLMPVIFMIDRRSYGQLDSLYCNLYKNALLKADSLAVKDLITWVWDSKDRRNDFYLIKEMVDYKIKIDWIYAENAQVVEYKNKLYSKRYPGIKIPFLISGNKIKKQSSNRFKSEGLSNNIVAVLDSKDGKSAKLAFNLIKEFSRPDLIPINRVTMPFYVKGVAYNPGEGNSNKQLILNNSKLTTDFELIKKMGANTIRRFAPSVYDYNILRNANRFGLKVMYGFSFERNFDYYKDSLKLCNAKLDVLKKVKKYKENSAIISWGVGNEVWNKLSVQFGQPYLSIVRTSYLKFIRELTQEIKQIDKNRPVSTSEEQESTGMYCISILLPNIDFMGLNTYYFHRVRRMKSITADNLNGIPYLVTEFGNDGYWLKEFNRFNKNEQIIEPSCIQKSHEYENIWNNYIVKDSMHNLGGVAFCWQDKYEGTATWFGLIDIYGNKKPAYYALQNAYVTDSKYSSTFYFPIPEVELKVDEKADGFCHVLAAFNGNENLYQKQYFFKWVIYEDDAKFKLIEETPFKGAENSFSFNCPNQNKKYRVYLYLKDYNGNVITESIPINFTNKKLATTKMSLKINK